MLDMSDASMDTFLYLIVEQIPELQALTVAQTRYFMNFDPLKDQAPVQKMKFEGELIYLPSTLHSGHWTLVMFSIVDNKLYVQDSWIKPTDKMLNQVRKLARGIRHHFDVDKIKDAEIIVIPCDGFQKKDLNCGAWLCYFSQQVANCQEVCKDEDMGNFRKKIFDKISQVLNE